MREQLRRLAELEPGDPPTLSIYLDLRPHATGENPAVRTGFIVLKDRLREIEKTLWPRGPALDSFRRDAQHIEDYVEHDLSASSQGVAIFACAGRDLFEVEETATPFENEVAIGPVPDLFQLAQLADDYETAVAAVVTSNTARLFVMRSGLLDEVSGLSEPSRNVRRTRGRAPSSRRYQRRITNNREGFAREAAQEIELLVEQENATRVFVAGNEVATPPLLAALSPRISAMVHEEALRMDPRAQGDEVADLITPLMEQAEMEDDHAIVDQLVEAVQADGLAVDGLESTRAALEHGQVDVLALDADAPLDEATRNELIRMAVSTGAEIEVIKGHAVLRELGGVGALLRYKHETAAPAVS